MRRWPILAIAQLLLWSLPLRGEAQVFLASRPDPDFEIGPLFVSTSITRASISGDRSPLRVTVAWSLVVRGKTQVETIAQDLYLLWPGELAVEEGRGERFSKVSREVEALGFKIKGGGALKLSVRARSEMGMQTRPSEIGDAQFVTFTHARAGDTVRGATYIRIPWTPHLLASESLLRLELPLREGVTRKPASWLEDLFWERRHLVSVSFGDVGYMSLYPMYFAHRRRVVPLAPDFSLLVVNFQNSDHLKTDEIIPASASRRRSEFRENTETVSVPLLASPGIAPQVLKVQFSYFQGRVAWRPILISLLLYVIGSVTGPLAAAFLRRCARTLRARVQVGPNLKSARGQQSGVILPNEALASIVPGETTYEEVMRRCGPHAEEHQQLSSRDRRAILYRGQRVVPHRHRSFGWFATVSHWDLERHEVEIEFERDRVRDIQVRVRRVRLTEPGPLTATTL